MHQVVRSGGSHQLSGTGECAGFSPVSRARSTGHLSPCCRAVTSRHTTPVDFDGPTKPVRIGRIWPFPISCRKAIVWAYCCYRILCLACRLTPVLACPHISTGVLLCQHNGWAAGFGEQRSGCRLRIRSVVATDPARRPLSLPGPCKPGCSQLSVEKLFGLLAPQYKSVTHAGRVVVQKVRDLTLDRRSPKCVCSFPYDNRVSL